MEQEQLEESLDDRILRVTKKELLRSHRAQPILVEGLLFVLHVKSRPELDSGSLDIEFILDLCHFHQKMKWLCPWGEDFINEACRPPIHAVPFELRDRLESDLYEHKRRGWLTHTEYQNLVEDEEQQWDRIYAYGDGPCIYLQYLHKHPCEEVHFFSITHVGPSEVEHLELCRDLQVLSFEEGDAQKGLSKALQKLNNLRFLDVSSAFLLGDNAVDTQIALHRALPRLTTLQVEKFREFDFSSLAAFIRERKASLQHFTFRGAFKRPIAEALASCENLVSIRIEDNEAVFEDIEPIFLSSSLQKTVKYVDLGECGSIEIFDPLCRFTELRWLNFDNAYIDDIDLQELILPNAHHLVGVSVRFLDTITKRILNTLESCTGLHAVVLDGTACKPEDIVEYKRLERRNHEALRI